MISNEPAAVADGFATAAVAWRPADTARRRERLVWISAAGLAVIYVALFLLGVRFFVYKTAILPLLLAYGLLVRQRALFVVDWLPLIAATLLFDAIRGGIYVLIKLGYQTFHVEYVARLEEAVFGVPVLSLPLQMMRTAPLDLVAVLVHASHFAFFLLFGLALWHTRREQFREFRRSLLLVMMFGLVAYAVIPTAPPWMAALPVFGAVPPIAHITEEIYTLAVPELYGTFSSNPVAAMPSLHVAFPVLCAIVAWRAYGQRIGLALSLYAGFVMFTAIYLGEHYGVDVIAGAAVALLAPILGRRMQSLDLSSRATIAVSAAGVALTYVIVLVSRAALPLPPAFY